MLKEAGECSVNPGGVAGRVHSLTRPGGEERFITQPLTRPSPADHPSEKLLPLFCVALLPVIFVVVFAFFRAFFAQLNPAQEAMAGPLWPLIKMLIKKLVALRVVFMVQASRNASVDRDHKKKDEEIADLKQNLRRLDKNAELLRARVARLETEEATRGVDLEV